MTLLAKAPVNPAATKLSSSTADDRSSVGRRQEHGNEVCVFIRP